MENIEDFKLDFLKYLKCKMDLLEIFIYGSHVLYDRTPDKYIFKNEFTYDNWKKGIIGKQIYKTGCKFIPDPFIFDKNYIVFNKKDKNILYNYSYSLYRGIPYNFKLNLYN